MFVSVAVFVVRIFLHVLILDILCRGFLFSDLIACLGSLDVVFGSVDR